MKILKVYDRFRFNLTSCRKRVMDRKVRTPVQTENKQSSVYLKWMHLFKTDVLRLLNKKDCHANSMRFNRFSVKDIFFNEEKDSKCLHDRFKSSERSTLYFCIEDWVTKTFWEDKSGKLKSIEQILDWFLSWRFHY